MTIYKSHRDRFFIIIYLMISVFLLGFVGFGFYDKTLDRSEYLIMSLILILILVVIFTMFFLIKIKIQQQNLIVNIGFDILKIDINNITKIRIGETMWSGFHKYGTSRGGLIIFIQNRNDVYITPKNQDEFLKQLLEINPQIKIDDVRKNIH